MAEKKNVDKFAENRLKSTNKKVVPEDTTSEITLTPVADVIEEVIEDDGVDSVSAEEVSFKSFSSSKKPQDNTRIRIKENHKCNIGGVWYNFLRGQCYYVPDNVRRILTEADLLLPL